MDKKTSPTRISITIPPLKLPPTPINQQDQSESLNLFSPNEITPEKIETSSEDKSSHDSIIMQLDMIFIEIKKLTSQQTACTQSIEKLNKKIAALEEKTQGFLNKNFATIQRDLIRMEEKNTELKKALDNIGIHIINNPHTHFSKEA